MDILIDINATTPLFAQVIEEIKQGIRNDALPPGTPLPSIRQLANDLDVNHNTVAKAYRLLERDRVIQTRGYRGTIIHPDAKVNCTTDLQAWATQKLDETISALRAAGITDSELRKAFQGLMKTNS